MVLQHHGQLLQEASVVSPSDCLPPSVGGCMACQGVSYVEAWTTFKTVMCPLV